MSIALLALACGREHESLLNRDFIRKDLETRSVGDLYDEVGAANYTPPADGCLSRKQIEGYLEFARLTLAIQDVARDRLGRHLDDAAQSQGRLDAIGAGAAAFGNAREIATADLRAAVLLGANISEERWIEATIASSAAVLQETARFDSEIEEARREAGRAVTESAAERQRAAVREAIRRRDDWQSRQSAGVISNARLVREHAAVLAPYFPLLR